MTRILMLMCAISFIIVQLSAEEEAPILKIRANTSFCQDLSLFQWFDPPYQIALASLPGSGRNWLYHLIKLAIGSYMIQPDHFLEIFLEVSEKPDAVKCKVNNLESNGFHNADIRRYKQFQ